MDQNVVNIVNSLLPSLVSSSQLIYNENINALLTQGYTSSAGNTYFNEIRVSERLTLVINDGQGYARLFMNGISIYNIEDKLIAYESFHNYFHSLDAVKSEAIKMLTTALINEIKNQGVQVGGFQLTEVQINREQINSFASSVIEEVFAVNQVEVLQKRMIQRKIDQANILRLNK